MSKVMRSLLCLVLSAVMLFSMNTFSAAAVSAETAVQPRYSYTAFTYAELDINAKGVATCYAEVEGYAGITTKVHIEMKLQKYTLWLWPTVETWEGTFNDYCGALSKTATVGNGTYRVQVVYTVYSGSSSEEITTYSQEKTITVS